MDSVDWNDHATFKHNFTFSNRPDGCEHSLNTLAIFKYNFDFIALPIAQSHSSHNINLPQGSDIWIIQHFIGWEIERAN